MGATAEVCFWVPQRGDSAYRESENPFEWEENWSKPIFGSGWAFGAREDFLSARGV